MAAVDYVASLERLGPIGDGAFGEVYQFRDPVHGSVAGKCFYKARFGSDAAWDEACADALKEAQNLKALEHAHVVKIHHVLRSPQDEEFLIVMEYCEGKSVRQVTETNVVSLPRAKAITRDAAMGLNYIHGKKYLHRDIKPDNILLTQNGTAKIGDFGFVTDELQFGFATPYGTALYWAPEVLVEKACSELSDVYSLGVTFVNLISGDHWFLRDGKGAMVRLDANGEPTLSPTMLYLPHVPVSWRNIANRLCRPTVAGRCPSLGAAVNLIAKLPAVEPWVCQVGDDLISWQMLKGRRRVRVEWHAYLGRAGEHWMAWTEDERGGGRRKLSEGGKGLKWRETYKSLQAFFASRNV